MAGHTLWNRISFYCPSKKSSNDNPIVFTGRRVDVLDDGDLTLQYSRNRYYDYYTGRWLTQDPIGYEDGMNLYEYVMSKPIKEFDPFGLFLDDWQKKITLGGYGVYAGIGYSVDVSRIHFRKNGYEYETWNVSWHAGTGIGSHVTILGIGYNLELKGPGFKGNIPLTTRKGCDEDCTQICGSIGWSHGFEGTIGIGNIFSISGSLGPDIQFVACYNTKKCKRPGLATAICGGIQANITVNIFGTTKTFEGNLDFGSGAHSGTSCQMYSGHIDQISHIYK